MSLRVIYQPPGPKKSLRVARASGFLEKTSGQSMLNQKALADCAAERMMPMVDMMFDTSWHYVGTLNVDARPYHYFQQRHEQEVRQHLWLTTENISF